MNGSNMEIPVLALMRILHYMDKRTQIPDVCTLRLFCKGYVSSFKTLDKFMAGVLRNGWGSRGLIAIEIPNQGTNYRYRYYGAHGLVLDIDYNPIMVCSWLMKRVYIDGKYKMKPIKPVIHLSSEIFVNQCNPLERYLSKKFLTGALSYPIDCPAFNTNIIEIQPSVPAEVIIGKMPFSVRYADTPSRSISDKELLALAAAHIDQFNDFQK